MRTEITINNNANASANYIGWTPVPGQIRLADPEGATTPVEVRLRNQDPSRGGQVVFFTSLSGTGQDELALNLPVDGSQVNFFLAGRFGDPSEADGDASIEVIDSGAGSALSVTPLMVRVRKNANNLTADERNRFLSAMARLNDRGMGRFSDFRNMHTAIADPEAHGNAGFLPWHRAYLLDLERELQQIDPSVAIPYWRFDQPAPNLFAREFIGVPNDVGAVQFTPDNPLQSWTTDLTLGIVRQPRFDTGTEPASNPSGPVISEAATLLLGGPGSLFGSFRGMESQPHGRAHTSFAGFISRIPTAARDPLFFLLHCNVDRLWAKWQWFNRRFDTTSAATYTFLGSAGDPGAARIGHNLNDTMWPWNQDTDFPRPSTAPGGDFPGSVITSAPGPAPAVLNMIDFQGVLTASRRLGFSYDDVPFEF